jgi:hypothetical protein
MMQNRAAKTDVLEVIGTTYWDIGDINIVSAFQDDAK